MVWTRSSTVERTEIRPCTKSSTPKRAPPWRFSSSKTCSIAAGAWVFTALRALMRIGSAWLRFARSSGM